MLSERKHEILHKDLKHTCTVPTFEISFIKALSIYPSIIYLSINLSAYLSSVYPSLSIPLSIYLPIHLSSSYPFLYCLYPCHDFSTLPSLYLSIYPVCLSIYPSYLSIHSSIYHPDPCIYPDMSRCISLSFSLSLSLSLYIYIYVYIHMFILGGVGRNCG